ncbi:MAG: hypothetical protein EXQ90_03085 [Rhodospirillales bacterium]|nr:hypothetical protein [Rhodospirillales bacterium]
MRHAIVGVVIGLVLGVAFGTTVVAPNLQRANPVQPAPAAEPRSQTDTLRSLFVGRPGDV